MALCALPAIDAIGLRCQPSLRMASACSWQRCLGHILHRKNASPEPALHLATARKYFYNVLSLRALLVGSAPKA